MNTTNPNIKIISFDDLNEALYRATSPDHPTTLTDQFDCDESLSHARASRISDESGNELGLVQIDDHAALIKQWRADHVRLAVWMIEEEIEANTVVHNSRQHLQSLGISTKQNRHPEQQSTGTPV